MVEADAKLLKGISNPDLPFPKVQVWFERLKAFCYLAQGGKQVLGQGTDAVTVDKDGQPLIADAYFVRQKIDFGTNKAQLVLPDRNLVLTSALPGAGGYATLVRENNVIVDKEHQFKDLRSVAEITQQNLQVQKTTKLHNLVVRGTIPKCSTDDDCAGTGGKVDPPLKCSLEQGYCSPPFARYGEECRRGVKECDPKGGPGGSRLACVGLRVRDKFFCFNACDSSVADENPDPDVDTRCGSAAKTRCFALRRTDPARPNGVCIRTCNSRAGNREALLKECELPKCGDGKLDYGETCDDGGTVSGDGCNKYCSLSTFDRCDNQSDCKGAGQTCEEPVFGQGTTVCTPPQKKEKDEDEENGKFRTICMEFDYCWPPDERADWLGKTDDVNGGNP
ncbi:MAG: hypothetical protein KC503_13740 [Myxococcales bacterium]|nr:hypothetical protein [Myxococcales bacterium]